MMFWIGLVIGLFVGANVGLLVIALCKISARADSFGKKDDTYYGQEVENKKNNDCRRFYNKKDQMV